MILACAAGLVLLFRETGRRSAKGIALLAQVIQECAANTVKHAEGDRIDLLPEEKDGSWIVRITNNGRPPKGPVAESGGLLSLRRHMEEAGGTMSVESTPAFALTLYIPGT